jgi:hypothetical protein
LLELGVLAYPKDKKYMDLIFEFVYQLCKSKEEKERVPGEFSSTTM